jgi:hypothetical protein
MRRLGQLFLIPPLDRWWRRQSTQAFNHCRYGRSRRIDGHHITRANNHKLHVFAKRDIPRQPERLTVADSKGSSSSDRHFGPSAPCLQSEDRAGQFFDRVDFRHSIDRNENVEPILQLHDDVHDRQ